MVSDTFFDMSADTLSDVLLHCALSVAAAEKPQVEKNERVEQPVENGQAGKKPGGSVPAFGYFAAQAVLPA